MEEHKLSRSPSLFSVTALTILPYEGIHHAFVSEKLFVHLTESQKKFFLKNHAYLRFYKYLVF